VTVAQVGAWPACKRWTSRYLCEAFRGRPALVANYDMDFADYLAYCRGSADDMPLYLFDAAFADKAPRLAADYAVRRRCRAEPARRRWAGARASFPQANAAWQHRWRSRGACSYCIRGERLGA